MMMVMMIMMMMIVMMVMMTMMIMMMVKTTVVTKPNHCKQMLEGFAELLLNRYFYFIRKIL